MDVGTRAHHSEGREGPGASVFKIVHYAYPMVLLLFFLGAFTARSILISRSKKQEVSDAPPLLGPGGKALPQTPVQEDAHLDEQEADFSRARKLLFNWITVGVTMTFVANAANVIVHALSKKGWWCGQDVVVYVVGTFFVYGLIVISLVDQKPSPNTAHVATWTISLIMELILLGASAAMYSSRHKEPHVDIIGPYSKQPKISGFDYIREHMSSWEIAEVIIDIIRILLILALISFYLLFSIARNARTRELQATASSSESTSLLHGAHGENGNANGSAQSYGATPPNVKPRRQENVSGWERPASTPSRSWWEYLRGYTVFFPYLWPSKDRKLQLVVVVCILLMIGQRVVNIIVPYQVGHLTNILSGEEESTMGQVWGAIILLIVVRLLQGNNGLLGALRSALWIPVGQYSYRELSVAAFEHVHSLSLDFHLGKKTGEVLSALNKGGSINTFLEQVTFQVLPMLVDLCGAFGFFLVSFDAYYSLTIAVVTFWYIYITIRMAQWRQEIRREMVNADREEEAVKNDSMVSYETVKYFNAEEYEFNRFRGAVARFQRAEAKVLYSLNLMNVCQNLVFMMGLLVVCFISAYQVTTGQQKVGAFTTVITYMAQLQAPLNFFGTFYRSIQSAMINSERMLELFKEKPTVVDEPEVDTMVSSQGDIRFNEVHFAYDSRKPALNGLDFQCAPGTTTALVGESGGGKSTVFRLLFRFYNLESGSIQVDGHDVRDISIDSLRQQIGVVPQDTVLFNETLMYNLKYANQEATNEDVYAACRAASIHDKIMTFPDGYDTKVGERGLRLSGGEKQRVAIARTILKNPRIILLDEATAALDTETEEHIQEALTTLGQGRTMLVIAHRLSTITLADQILVLHEGRVDERGSHDELLARRGRYASMWRKQVRAQRAAEEARVLKDRAERLRKEAGEADGGSTSQSEDESHHHHQANGQRRAHQHQSSSSSGAIPPPPVQGGQGHDDSHARQDLPAGHP